MHEVETSIDPLYKSSQEPTQYKEWHHILLLLLLSLLLSLSLSLLLSLLCVADGNRGKAEVSGTGQIRGQPNNCESIISFLLTHHA